MRWFGRAPVLIDSSQHTCHFIDAIVNVSVVGYSIWIKIMWSCEMELIFFFHVFPFLSFISFFSIHSFNGFQSNSDFAFSHSQPQTVEYMDRMLFPMNAMKRIQIVIAYCIHIISFRNHRIGNWQSKLFKKNTISILFYDRVYSLQFEV